jgi:hypothetical protein
MPIRIAAAKAAVAFSTLWRPTAGIWTASRPPSFKIRLNRLPDASQLSSAMRISAPCERPYHTTRRREAESTSAVAGSSAQAITAP